MKFKDRVPKELFTENNHYLGRPADADTEFIKRRIKLVESIPGFTGKDKTLLEIGCGNGASMFLLANKMKKCVGIDINDAHKEEFDKYKAQHNVSNCEYKVLDVVNSTPEEKFDRIISFEVIEHLSDENGLQYYYDALKDDGILAITVPNKWWIFETHGAKLPLLPWNRVPFFSWLPTPIHEKYANARIYTRQRITKLLEKYGFSVIDYKYITAPLDVLPEGKVKKLLLKYIFNSETTKNPIKSPSIFLVAKKAK
jgi:2-polyprenyl-3-methyl-5-hydroxy-6-metoxy-1,4-benzoquinol methylase